MCLELRNSTTPFGVARDRKAARKIIQSVASRFLYLVYGCFAFCGVLDVRKDDCHWYYLLFFIPIGLLVLETIYMVRRKGNERKWVTPSILIYLLIGIPCVWILESKLFSDRVQKHLKSQTTTIQTNSTLQTSTSQPDSNNSSCTIKIPIDINLPHEDWAHGLEQFLIFVLIFGKWIAPKGEVSRNELSQLLLTYLGAGADILDFVGITDNDELKKLQTDKTIFYIVMVLSSWSLLQFCFVSTASKDLPPLNHQDEELITYEDINKKARSNTLTTDFEVKLSTIEKPTSAETQSDFNTLDETHVTISSAADTRGGTRGEDELKTENRVDKVAKSSRCFQFFCFYNEIWGMVLGIVFQDVPFFIVRMFILFYHKIVNDTTIFFTLKNALVILLTLNRIRIIVLEDHKPWKNHMYKAKLQRFREKNLKRQQRGLPPK